VQLHQLLVYVWRCCTRCGGRVVTGAAETSGSLRSLQRSQSAHLLSTCAAGGPKRHWLTLAQSRTVAAGGCCMTHPVGNI
jgi:hypothetical protein